MSNLFTDLPLTQYPNQIDVIVDRTSTSPTYFKRYEDNKDIILSGHVKALQDAVVAIERTLGIMPHGSYQNIQDRLNSIEGRLLTTNDVLNIVKAHKHDGTGNNPPKIDLTNEVSNKLSKNNIELAYGNSNALTASDIYVSSNTTILNALNNKLDKNGGTVTGDITINGKTNMNTAKSIIFDMATVDNFIIGANGAINNNVQGANFQKAVYNSTINTSSQNYGSMFKYISSNMLYNQYVAILRIKVLSPTESVNSSQTVLKFSAKSGSLIETLNLTYGILPRLNDWISIYLTFDHKEGSNIEFEVTYPLKWPSLIYCDSLIVIPTHTAIFDII